MRDETLQWLKENDYTIDDIDRVGKHGNSALMKSTREARSEVVEYILSLSPDLEIKNVDGNTALWNACFGQSYRCVELLVKSGIDLAVTPSIYKSLKSHTKVTYA